ncbi:MAG: recombination-associated protein RdgC [Methylococcaceae bacterium]
MFFKNITLYALDGEVTADALEQGMQEKKAHECGQLDASTSGWTTIHDHLALPFQGGFAICLQTLEKIMPAASINRLVNERIKSLDQEVTRKEKISIKEAIIVRILPEALIRELKTYAYIDTQANLLVIDATGSRAENLVSLFIRATEGKVKVNRVDTMERSVIYAMMDWVTRKPDWITIDEDIDLKHFDSTIKFRGTGITPEIEALVEDGAEVTMLAITVKDSASFQLTPSLILKKFAVDGCRIAEDEAEDQEAALVADFIIQAGVIREVFGKLIEVMQE